MSFNTKNGFGYIPNKRFIVEIKDNDTGRLFYTKRIKLEREAFNVRNDYNSLHSMTALVCDTLTGEMY